MATKSSTFEPGPVLGAFLWPLRMAVLTALVFMGLWLAAVSWQTYYAQRDADDEGAAKALADLLDQDLEYAGEMRAGAIDPLDLAYTIGSNINNTVFGAIVASIRSVMNLPANWQRMSKGRMGDVGGAYAQEELMTKYGGWMRAASTATMVFAVRTALLLSAAPLAALLYVVALTDGYAARAVRRANAGRESAGLYHRAKLGQVWLLALAWMLYVCMPVGVDPRLFTHGVVLGLALLARVQAKWTKKYL